MASKIPPPFTDRQAQLAQALSTGPRGHPLYYVLVRLIGATVLIVAMALSFR